MALRKLRLLTRLGAAASAAGIAAFVLLAPPAVPQAVPNPLGGRAAPMLADTAPEALLVATLNAIARNQLDIATAEIDRVIARYPNFRLAHLIKGDLLMARARPISNIGAAQNVPADRVADLREEARARLARYAQERPADRVPRYLLQMAPEQKYAMVVDTGRSTLFVFQNVNGEPKLVSDYYVTSGKNGSDKTRSGDKRTPLGVYHVTGSLPRERLDVLYGKQAELYGVGALPINYPNEWDKREGREGNGIWLHGVPYDTYSRPPRASDGCVALTNQDFEAIAKQVQVGSTPVIISSGIEWVASDAMRKTRADFIGRFEQWRQDWESLDSGRYLAHYAPGFSAGKQNLEQWSQQKRTVNAAKTWIKVKATGVSAFLYPGREDLAVVTFEQDYASSNLENRMRKRQYWLNEGGIWKIIYEGAA
ncbi:MAG: L,D-transpeptidase Cds6 family protein [Burkholderiales bacterium]